MKSFIKIILLFVSTACTAVPLEIEVKEETRTATDSGVDETSKHILDITSIMLPKRISTSLGLNDCVFPTLGAVKYDNSRSPQNGFGKSSHPIPVGWLYYNRDDMENIYYSFGVADNLDRIFSWDKSIKGSEEGILFYSVAICPNGDIICVPRSETFFNRDNNPIVYKHDDLEHPVEVYVQDKNNDGESIRPVGWFSNSGMSISTEGEYLIFAEYTRPDGEPANIWRVSKPYDNPSNWKIVYASSGKGEEYREVEHFHSVNYDYFTGRYYVISGDTARESKIFMSSDEGKSFSVVYGGDGDESTRLRARAINMVFTQDCAYYGSDQGPFLIRVFRDKDGFLDFGTIEIVRDKEGRETISPPSGYMTGEIYFTCLSDAPYGILLLGYKGGTGKEGIQILFYDINKDSFFVLRTLDTINDKQNGFRCDAVNIYQSILEPRFVVGYGNINNYNDLPGNKGNQYMNLALRLL